MANDYGALMGAPPAGGASSPYGSLMDAFAANDEARLRATVGLAAGTKPDRVAGAKRTAEALGTSTAAVQALPDDAARQARVQQVLADTAQAPVLRQRYTDADFAALAHDDSGALAGVEHWLKYAFSHPGSANTLAGDLGAGLHEGSAGIAGVFRAGSELAAPLLDFSEATTPQEFAGWRGAIGGNPLRRLAEGFSSNAQTNLQSSKDLSPAQQGVFASGISSGIKSAAQNLATLPLAFLPGGEAAALSGMVSMQGGQSYQQAREQGVPMSQALPFAVSQAAIEYATEKIPLTKLLGDVKGGAPIWQTILHQAATEIPGEQIATVLQDLNEWAVLPENAGKPFSAYLAERPSAAAQTLIATIVGTGGNIAVTKSLDAVTADMAARESKAMRAEQGAQAFTALGQLAAASKVLERDPQTFQAFVEAAAEDGPVQNVFISADALAQSGVAEQVAAASPSVQAQFATALETGADIKIPVAEYATIIAGQSYAQNLVDHLKVEADGFSRAEAQEMMKTHGDEMRRQVEVALAGHDEAARTSRQAVEAQVLDQLNAAKRFTPEVNAQYASLVGAFYGTQAERLGTTAEDLFQRYPLRVQAQSPVGQALNQGSLADVLQQWDTAGIAHSASENGGVISLDRIIVPKGERGQGVGTTAMQQLVEYADATGQRVELSPSTDFGATSKGRLEKFYKRFGFAANKGRGRDLTTRATMLREPQLLAQSAVAEETEQDRTNSLDAARISPRIPTAKKATEDGLGDERLQPDLETAKRSPEAFAFNIGLMAAYPNFEGLEGTPDEMAEVIVQHSVDNLLWLHDHWKPEYRERSRKWYVGGNRIAHRWAKRFGVTPEQVAAVIAATSPQKDWFQNVSLAERILEAVVNHDDMPWDAKMTELVKSRDWGKKEVLDPSVYEGKTLRQLFQSAESLDAMAIWIRAWDEAYNPMKARVITPEGGFASRFDSGKTGKEIGLRWQTFPTIVKTLQVLMNDSREKLSEIIGANHKVRSFFNNIIAPYAGEDVTIDTHAVAAALLRPLGSSSTEVFHNFGSGEPGQPGPMNSAVTGLNGTYAIYAEAYRRAAKERGVLPREMQSITWEAVRGLFRPEQKNEKIRAEADRIWSSAARGEIDASSARKQIEELVGGIANPAWVGSAAGADEAPVDSSYAGGLHPRSGAQGAADGRGGVDAASGIQPGQPADGQLNQGAGQRGAFSPSTNTITLLKGADLSTFLHELGHFQLEVLADMAAQPNAPAEIKADMQTLLDWFGVKADTPEGALETWHRMTLDEKRAGHEQFARGFEAFLFEGKAPSIELRGIFQRFRAWLVNVYRNLKALNVELTADVRGVMDRLLATEDQIRNAEAAASMGLLFKTPEEAAKFGVEWQAYHDQSMQATADAVDMLAERGLKDMQWLSRAKARELKKLQKDADAKRREVEAEVRAEIMAQPVYQAWQYLTGKPTVELNDADKEALAQHAAAFAAWKAKRAEAETRAKADVRAELAAEHPEAKGIAKGQLLAKNKRQLDINAQQRMLEWDQANPKPVKPTPGPQAPIEADQFGKLSTEDVKARYGNAEGSITRKLSGEGMLKADGEDPDITAELFAYDSGDAMMQALAAAKPPEVAIADLTDQRMLERYGDITSPQALETAANEAVHNAARAKFVATELKALEKANDVRRDAGTDKKGRPRTAAMLPEAARQFAADLIARLKVRDVSPGQYQAAEARAAREAAKALKSGDVVGAAREKRNQLINHYATKEALAAQAEVAKALKYLARVERSDSIDAEYRDQISQLLERYSLARESLKAIDKRKSLKEWVAQQEAAGMLPDIPPALLEGIDRKSYRDMTVEEVRGLVDTVKQIEHIGRLKQKLLTARDQRTYEAIRDEIAASIITNGQGRQADTRTPTTNAGRWFQGIRNFGAAHIKAATWARIMDGNKDGGAMWEHLIRSANERADQETTMRAEATQRLSEILAPVMKGVRSGKSTFYPSIGKSYNREAVLAMALNTGNAGNLQRLLGGEGWTIEQLKPVLDTLTAQEWQAVQAVWDHFETYRPLIAAKERRVYGKEPKWIDPTPVVTKFGTLKGGYYPVKYDPAASARAEERADAEEAAAMLKGAYSSATTRRSFTKSRVESVVGRPLLYTMQGLYGGVNEVIHDLAWHEWLIDANRLMRSDKIDTAMRETYGPAAVRQFKTWREAIATGDAGTQEAIDKALGRLRQGVSIAGLGFNVMSAAMQPLGITQSIVRVGAKWIGKGVAQYAANPLAAGRLVQAQSEFMRNRARTRFRELNELRNQVQGQTVLKERLQANTFVLMMKAQQTVDIPTWLGAYEKGMSEKPDEDRAIALADQAVIDSQGGGQLKDLSAIERGGPAQKLFTVFYGFRNTALNLAVAQGMSERSAAKKAADMLLLSTVPAVLSYFLKNALTPGDSGDDDESLLKKLLAAQLSDLFGLFVVGREFADVAKIVTGTGAGDYTGPAGVRLVADTAKFAQQAAQLEFDDAFRRAAVNLTGDAFGLPAAQINRTITGAEALSEGDTENPAALVFGFQRPH